MFKLKYIIKRFNDWKRNKENQISIYINRWKYFLCKIVTTLFWIGLFCILLLIGVINFTITPISSVLKYPCDKLSFTTKFISKNMSTVSTLSSTKKSILTSSSSSKQTVSTSTEISSTFTSKNVIIYSRINKTSNSIQYLLLFSWYFIFTL